ncbi:unnamed protein product [Amoebophrya sp. A120]|nr:unnamed protein product [Amoebophrya sp. A120]|eukprot:GSA120T00020975001.1
MARLFFNSKTAAACKRNKARCAAGRAAGGGTTKPIMRNRVLFLTNLGLAAAAGTLLLFGEMPFISQRYSSTSTSIVTAVSGARFIPPGVARAPNQRGAGAASRTGGAEGNDESVRSVVLPDASTSTSSNKITRRGRRGKRSHNFTRPELRVDEELHHTAETDEDDEQYHHDSPCTDVDLDVEQLPIAGDQVAAGAAAGHFYDQPQNGHQELQYRNYVQHDGAAYHTSSAQVLDEHVAHQNFMTSAPAACGFSVFAGCPAPPAGGSSGCISYGVPVVNGMIPVTLLCCSPTRGPMAMDLPNKMEDPSSPTAKSNSTAVGSSHGSGSSSATSPFAGPVMSHGGNSAFGAFGSCNGYGTRTASGWNNSTAPGEDAAAAGVNYYVDNETTANNKTGMSTGDHVATYAGGSCSSFPGAWTSPGSSCGPSSSTLPCGGFNMIPCPATYNATQYMNGYGGGSGSCIRGIIHNEEQHQQVQQTQTKMNSCGTAGPRPPACPSTPMLVPVHMPVMVPTGVVATSTSVGGAAATTPPDETYTSTGGPAQVQIPLTSTSKVNSNALPCSARAAGGAHAQEHDRGQLKMSQSSLPPAAPAPPNHHDALNYTTFGCDPLSALRARFHGDGLPSMPAHPDQETVSERFLADYCASLQAQYADLVAENAHLCDLADLRFEVSDLMARAEREEKDREDLLLRRRVVQDLAARRGVVENEAEADEGDQQRDPPTALASTSSKASGGAPGASRQKMKLSNRSLKPNELDHAKKKQLQAVEARVFLAKGRPGSSLDEDLDDASNEMEQTKNRTCALPAAQQEAVDLDSNISSELHKTDANATSPTASSAGATADREQVQDLAEVFARKKLPFPRNPGSAGHPYACFGDGCKYFQRGLQQGSLHAGCKDGDRCTRCHICCWKNTTGRNRKGKQKRSSSRGQQGFDKVIHDAEGFNSNYTNNNESKSEKAGTAYQEPDQEGCRSYGSYLQAQHGVPPPPPPAPVILDLASSLDLDAVDAPQPRDEDDSATGVDYPAPPPPPPRPLLFDTGRILTRSNTGAPSPPPPDDVKRAFMRGGPAAAIEGGVRPGCSSSDDLEASRAGGTTKANTTKVLQRRASERWADIPVGTGEDQQDDEDVELMCGLFSTGDRTPPPPPETPPPALVYSNKKQDDLVVVPLSLRQHSSRTLQALNLHLAEPLMKKAKARQDKLLLDTSNPAANRPLGPAMVDVDVGIKKTSDLRMEQHQQVALADRSGLQEVEGENLSEVDDGAASTSSGEPGWFPLDFDWRKGKTSNWKSPLRLGLLADDERTRRSSLLTQIHGELVEGPSSVRDSPTATFSPSFPILRREDRQYTPLRLGVGSKVLSALGVGTVVADRKSSPSASSTSSSSGGAMKEVEQGVEDVQSQRQRGKHAERFATSTTGAGCTTTVAGVLEDGCKNSSAAAPSSPSTTQRDREDAKQLQHHLGTISKIKKQKRRAQEIKPDDPEGTPKLTPKGMLRQLSEAWMPSAGSSGAGTELHDLAQVLSHESFLSGDKDNSSADHLRQNSSTKAKANGTSTGPGQDQRVAHQQVISRDPGHIPAYHKTRGAGSRHFHPEDLDVELPEDAEAMTPGFNATKITARMNSVGKTDVDLLNDGFMLPEQATPPPTAATIEAGRSIFDPLPLRARTPSGETIVLSAALESVVSSSFIGGPGSSASASEQVQLERKKDGQMQTRTNSKKAKSTWSKNKRERFLSSASSSGAGGAPTMGAAGSTTTNGAHQHREQRDEEAGGAKTPTSNYTTSTERVRRPLMPQRRKGFWADSLAHETGSGDGGSDTDCCPNGFEELSGYTCVAAGGSNAADPRAPASSHQIGDRGVCTEQQAGGDLVGSDSRQATPLLFTRREYTPVGPSTFSVAPRSDQEPQDQLQWPEEKKQQSVENLPYSTEDDVRTEPEVVELLVPAGADDQATDFLSPAAFESFNFPGAEAVNAIARATAEAASDVEDVRDFEQDVLATDVLSEEFQKKLHLKGRSSSFSSSGASPRADDSSEPRLGTQQAVQLEDPAARPVDHVLDRSQPADHRGAAPVATSNTIPIAASHPFKTRHQHISSSQQPSRSRTSSFGTATSNTDPTFLLSSSSPMKHVATWDSFNPELSEDDMFATHSQSQPQVESRHHEHHLPSSSSATRTTSVLKTSARSSASSNMPGELLVSSEAMQGRVSFHPTYDSLGHI